MSIQPLLHWLFGPHFFDAGTLLCLAVGVALALSSDPKDVSAALWFFGISALFAAGRAAHWLVTDNSPPLPKPVLASILFGAIGAIWIMAHSWAYGKLVVVSSKPNEFAPIVAQVPTAKDAHPASAPDYVTHQTNPEDLAKKVAKYLAEQALQKSPSVPSTSSGPPVVIQAPATFGNIKERAMVLGQEIMDDLYSHGWYRGASWQVFKPSQETTLVMPQDASTLEAWVSTRSTHFKFTHLNRVRDIRNEFAQLYTRNTDLDQFLANYRDDLPRPLDTLILPQQIERVAKDLKDLADHVK